MKFITSVFLLLNCFVYAYAQSESLLPVDEQGKFIYYEVVPLEGTTKNALKDRVINYLKKQHKEIQFKSLQGDTAFIATGKMVINKTLLVMSHPSGEILYRFQAEVKEGKYRFWLSDFSFIPYQRDRYGNFVASTTIGASLERDPGKLNAAQWKEYQMQAAKYAKEFASKFKQFMVSKISIAESVPEKKVISKSW
ncbi:DUF4468 domain-containing protein [Pedobacter boryungensis]|uniref:DUF4468 domain-containing protein n=1 Tax=Pedobacter boryungensis TaxID=869962 RepID=A0ABX2DHN5_9SPHI|nr:DUF4468 domain-containing protein [Pedobacter boryungensis]NQX32456.1 DUF4468 domain-containing protein [Pedobacter boryungensis]